MEISAGSCSDCWTMHPRSAQDLQTTTAVHVEWVDRLGNLGLPFLSAWVSVNEFLWSLQSSKMCWGCIGLQVKLPLPNKHIHLIHRYINYINHHYPIINVELIWSSRTIFTPQSPVLQPCAEARQESEPPGLPNQPKSQIVLMLRTKKDWTIVSIFTLID